MPNREIPREPGEITPKDKKRIEQEIEQGKREWEERKKAPERPIDNPFVVKSRE